MREISVSTCFDYSLPVEQQLPLIREAGFSHVSIGGNYEHSGILDEQNLPTLQRLLAESNLSVDTIHGYAIDKADTLEINGKITRAAATLQAPVIVLHCSGFAIQPETLEDRKKDLLGKLSAFEKLASASGVKFALENVLPGVATDLVEFVIDQANPEHFGFCYDSAHDQIDGPRSFDLPERLSDRLIAVHLSDRIKELVDHVIPGEGFIAFEKLTAILSRAQIDFPLLMEVMTTHSRHKEPRAFLAATHQKAVALYDGILAAPPLKE